MILLLGDWASISVALVLSTKGYGAFCLYIGDCMRIAGEFWSDEEKVAGTIPDVGFMEDSLSGNGV